MQWFSHDAPISSCLSANGAARSIAKGIAVGDCVADSTTYLRARAVAAHSGAIGKVHTAGQWQDAAVRQNLADALGTRLASALRPDFEWYYCRGAFFHNDAHYDARLFGVWYIEGAAMQLVFPRAALRVDIAPSSVVVFDPFEVHGVLAPGSTTYAANDYRTVPASVFVGFELDINDDVADAFGIDNDVAGQVISSRTRIDPVSGTISLAD
jgi:hypothetical protein